MFESEAFLVIFLFCIGSIFGSFANVVIYRLPRDENIAFPGSHCTSCGAKISWYHNIPIFAWFWLRGKCAKCKSPYSFRYPLVEFLMGALFAIAGATIGFHWTLLEALIFIFGLVTVSFIDLDHMILPDKFTLSGIAIGLAGALLNPERSFVDALIGAVAGVGFLWSVAYLYLVFRGREGMGGGDVKLLGWIGAVLGWKAIPFTILVSSLLGSVIGIFLAIKNRKDTTNGEGLNYAIPFGPYLAIAALIYMLCDGQNLADWYLSLHGM